MIALGLAAAWLVLSLIAGRVAFLTIFDGEVDDEVAPFLFAIAILWPLTMIGLVIWGLGKIVTMPPRKTRLRARRDRAQAAIDRLERELEIGTNESPAWTAKPCPAADAAHASNSPASTSTADTSMSTPRSARTAAKK